METNVSIPQLTTEQLQAARAAATLARRQRADLKAGVRSGAITLSKALDSATGDDVLAHVKVVDLLKALPRVGEKRAAAVMERLDIAPNRRIRGPVSYTHLDVYKRQVLRSIPIITTVQGRGAGVQGIEAQQAGTFGVRSLQSWADAVRTELESKP